MFNYRLYGCRSGSECDVGLVLQEHRPSVIWSCGHQLLLQLELAAVPVSGICGRRVVAVGGEHEVSGVDYADGFVVFVARAVGLRARCLW